MKKTIIAVVIILVIGVGLYFARDLIPAFGTKKGQLQVQSRPAASLFLNGENKGVTPYDEKLDPGDYELRLVPENEETTSTWQQNIKINEGLETFIRVYLGDSAVTSSWEIISLEKIDRGETEVAIFSQTDASEIYFDGEKKGTTPLSFQDVPEGDHEIRLVAPGFEEKTIEIVVTKGYKLDVSTQLALVDPDAANTTGDETEDEAVDEAVESEESDQTEEESEDVQGAEDENAEESKSTTPTPTDEASASAEKGDTITIDSPTTGWLRVRKEASTASEEVGKVDDGESFVILEIENGWYKIEYDKEGNAGWISGQYTTKAE